MICIINRTLFSVVCLKQNECRLGRVLVLGKQHVKACDLFTNHTLARATRVFFANFRQENLKYFPFLLYFPFCISKTCHFRAVCGMQKTGTVMRSIFYKTTGATMFSGLFGSCCCFKKKYNAKKTLVALANVWLVNKSHAFTCCLPKTKTRPKRHSFCFRQTTLKSVRLIILIR